MSAEDLYIKKIEGGIRGIRMGTKTPQEANIGIHLNKLKLVNEGMYDDFMEKYKKAVSEYNRKNNK